MYRAYTGGFYRPSDNTDQACCTIDVLWQRLSGVVLVIVNVSEGGGRGVNDAVLDYFWLAPLG
jgi:hypothetical protein